MGVQRVASTQLRLRNFCYLWSRVNGKLQLALLPIVYRQSLHQKRCETRASTTTKRVEDQETLQSCALIHQLANPVQNQVHNLLSNCVMSPGIVIGCILFSSDKLLWMEQLTICSSMNLIWKMYSEFSVQDIQTFRLHILNLHMPY